MVKLNSFRKDVLVRILKGENHRTDFETLFNLSGEGCLNYVGGEWTLTDAGRAIAEEHAKKSNVARLRRNARARTMNRIKRDYGCE
jgi:hypothetical protein